MTDYRLHIEICPSSPAVIMILPLEDTVHARGVPTLSGIRSWRVIFIVSSEEISRSSDRSAYGKGGGGGGATGRGRSHMRT
jgi:hypothetical protein